MPILKYGKKIAEKITAGSGPLDRGVWTVLVRPRMANAFRFKDDGVCTNHPHWPLVVYRGAVQLSADVRSGCNLRGRFFARNGSARLLAKRHLRLRALPLPGFMRFWRSPGIGQGPVRRQSRPHADDQGRRRRCPASRHRPPMCDASDDFLVVGAYPPDGTYDECTSSQDACPRGRGHPQSQEAARADPVYGGDGQVLDLGRRVADNECEPLHFLCRSTPSPMEAKRADDYPGRTGVVAIRAEVGWISLPRLQGRQTLSMLAQSPESRSHAIFLSLSIACVTRLATQFVVDGEISDRTRRRLFFRRFANASSSSSRKPYSQAGGSRRRPSLMLFDMLADPTDRLITDRPLTERRAAPETFCQIRGEP